MKSSLLSEQIIRWVHSHGYRVLRDGRLASPSGSIRTSIYDRDGYATVTVRLPVLMGHGRRQHRLYVHRLAAFQKFGEAIFQKGIQVRHRDGNPRNSRPANLLLGTQSQNMMDRPPEVRRQLAIQASQHVRRFTDAQIDRMFIDRAAGMTYKELGKKYRARKSVLSYIFNRATYTAERRAAAN